MKGLVEEVARLGSEKEKLEGEMSRERIALQGLLENLTNKQHQLVMEKKDILVNICMCWGRWEHGKGRWSVHGCKGVARLTCKVHERGTQGR